MQQFPPDETSGGTARGPKIPAAPEGEIVAHVRGGAFLRSVFHRYGIYLIFIFIFIIASILSDAFLTAYNLINILRQISFIGIIALGVTGVIVCAGIDLSSGSLVGLSSVVAASFAQIAIGYTPFYPAIAGAPVIVPIVVCLLVGALVGLVNGSLIARTLIPPFIATLGMYSAARGAALLYTTGRPLSNLDPTFNFIGQGSFLGIPIPVLLLLCLAVITHILYSRTRFGKYIYAIGGNEQAAHVSGINVARYKTLIYVYASTLAAIAGLAVTARIGSGQPGLGASWELDAIAAAVIGGTSLSAGGIGTVAGTLVGALIIGVLNNILDLTNVSAYWQQIIKGTIIVGAVILDQRRNRGNR